MGFRLEGKREAEKLQRRIRRQVAGRGRNTRPTLSVVLVGNHPSSETYVAIKKRFGETIGVNVKIHRITNRESRTSDTLYSPPFVRGGQKVGELRRLIMSLNRSKSIHGILLQLPLPRGFNAQESIDLIDRGKDVDGLRADSLVKSPVAEAVRHLLQIALKEGKKERRKKKRGALLVKSDAFARNLLKSLSDFPVEWRVERVTRRRGVSSHLSLMRRCDILISALGFPHAIAPNMVKRGAVILDVGFTKTQRGVRGDVHPDCYERSSFYSPVPGGVGPLTVAYVFKNLLKLWKTLNS